MAPGTPTSRPGANRFVAVILLLAVGFNLWGLSAGWKNLNLPGYEFRQTQTAISALFIQREHNFSPAYPTPVLGKPWSVPFEFPLYQWTVVGVSNALRLPLAEAGRAVSAACFHLALVALALLLRRLGLAWPQLAVALALLLTCPLYVFYGRAFLIETMALMFSLWYLAALFRALEDRRPGWLVLAALAGAGAGLVKVTTFIVCLVPAFGWTLAWLWAARPRAGPGGWRALLRTLGWLAAIHVPAFAATLAWVKYADTVKALNPSGATLTSSGLAAFNFGYGRHLDLSTWQAWYGHITANFASGPLLLAMIVLPVFAGRWRWHAFACLGVFLAAQLIFPVLYARHGYYYVACAFLPVTALGFALAGLQGGRLPRWVTAGIWLAVLAVQIHFYLTRQYPGQRVPGNGGGLAEVMRAITGEEQSLIVAGDDWSSVIPYYSGRRALMIRNDLTNDSAYLDRAFAALQDTPVAALILMGPEQANTALLARATAAFELDPKPLVAWRHDNQAATVYLASKFRPDALTVLRHRTFSETTLLASAEPETNPLVGQPYPYAKLTAAYQRHFRTINPRPVRFLSTFGAGLSDGEPGHERFAANPDTRLWFALPPGRHRLTTDLDLVESSWLNVPVADGSDGVELIADAVFPDGRRKRLQSRYLNPREHPEDRGLQPIDWAFELPAGAELELSVGPGPAHNGARDWASLGPITIN